MFNSPPFISTAWEKVPSLGMETAVLCRQNIVRESSIGEIILSSVQFHSFHILALRIGSHPSTPHFKLTVPVPRPLVPGSRHRGQYRHDRQAGSTGNAGPHHCRSTVHTTCELPAYRSLNARCIGTGIDGSSKRVKQALTGGAADHIEAGVMKP